MFLVCLLPSLAIAQADIGHPSVTSPDFDPSKLSDQEILDLLRQFETRRDFPQRTLIMGIPSGFGAPRGFGFVSFAATDRRERGRSGDWDGSMVLGFGLGNAQTAIGITPVVEITSVTPSHFGSSGRLGLHFSRRFPFGNSWQGAAGLGLQNLLTWGDSSVLDPEWNLSFSSVRPADTTLGIPILISAGYGSGVSRFGSDPGFYGGVGIGVHKSFGLSMAWYGDEAITGVNFWPFPEKNLLISLGIGDTFNNVSGRRILLTVSLGKRFDRR
jgi:hypothetical protein